jgi:hypothetical protein
MRQRGRKGHFFLLFATAPSAEDGSFTVHLLIGQSCYRPALTGERAFILVRLQVDGDLAITVLTDKGAAAPNIGLIALGFFIKPIGFKDLRH